MHANPVLKKLGYSNTDRLVIIHTDDIGMCQASVQAYSELTETGVISSGATMVPCSWFPSIVQYCKLNSNADMGVHLTLTSEWETYRWGPLTTRDHESGLLDNEGYFFRSSEEVQEKGVIDYVEIELSGQIDRAKSSGIDISHLDTHMNTVAHPKFINIYIMLAIKYHLPFLYPRLDQAGFQKLGLNDETSKIGANFVNTIEEQDLPLVDHITGLQLIDPENRFDQAKKILTELPAGVTHFIIHPSKNTVELQAITPDWKCRVADFNTFMDEKMRLFINKSGLHVIGYCQLKALIK